MRKSCSSARADASRRAWEIGGPYFPGNAVYAMAYDGRQGRQRIWAGPNSMHWGGLLRTSDDFGATWTNPEEANIKFPESTVAGAPITTLDPASSGARNYRQLAREVIAAQADRG